MGQISRVYTFNNSIPMLADQVDQEILNIVNTWNNFDKGTQGGTAPTFVLLTVTGQAILHGTSTNDNAAAGYIGETQSSTFSLTSFAATLTNKILASISLTAGDWRVTGSYNLSTPGTLTSSIEISVVTNGASGTLGQNTLQRQMTSGLNAPDSLSISSYRFSLASTTTIDLLGLAVYAGTTPGAEGYLTAVRIR